MSKAPILGFICPSCHHGMHPVCPACAEAEAEEAGRQAMLDQHVRGERVAALHQIEGYSELLALFEGAHGVEIEIEADADEDGPTGVFTATLCGVPWLQADGGQGSSPEAAVKALRAEIAKALRSMADEVQP